MKGGNSMKRTTVKEYNLEGKLIKETITEEDETPTINNPAPILVPWCPPYYPTTPVTPWYDGTVKITWDSIK